jgi:hypothetical protein
VTVAGINGGYGFRQLFDLGDDAARRGSVQLAIGLEFSRARREM